METTKVNLVYFSATYSTKRVLEFVAEGFGDVEVKSYDITNGYDDEVVFTPNELMLVGMPVYSGRIPQLAVEALNRFKGQLTPAVVVCVYGNRDYDDALLELKDIVETNGFKTVSAGAFIAQHSIFPEVGSARPDKDDKQLAIAFGADSLKKLLTVDDANSLKPVAVKGNKPYRDVRSVPLRPRGNRRCNECGTCVKLCPTGAIIKELPWRTDKRKCISCGRCISVCPKYARNFGGLLYNIASKKFTKTYAQRKAVEVFL